MQFTVVRELPVPKTFALTGAALGDDGTVVAWSRGSGTLVRFRHSAAADSLVVSEARSVLTASSDSAGGMTVLSRVPATLLQLGKDGRWSEQSIHHARTPASAYICGEFAVTLALDSISGASLSTYKIHGLDSATSLHTQIL